MTRALRPLFSGSVFLAAGIAGALTACQLLVPSVETTPGDATAEAGVPGVEAGPDIGSPKKKEDGGKTKEAGATTSPCAALAACCDKLSGATRSNCEGVVEGGVASTCTSTLTTYETNGSSCGREGGSDAGDGGADACGTVEDCSNGIDDDCNGLIDCADPACGGDAGGWSCSILPNETGWTLVAYGGTGQGACPSLYSGAMTSVVVSASASADGCACNCSNTKAASCGGNWAWTTKGNTPSCGPAPTTGGNGFSNGGCIPSNGTDNLAPTDYFVGAPNSVHTVAGSCTGTSSVSSSPAVSQVSAETCGLPQAGGGCDTGAVCAPKAPAGFLRCSVAPDGGACPTGLVSTTVYSGVSDTRGCGSCACGTVDLSCNVTGMYYWENANCSGGIFPMNESCQQVSGSSLGDEGGNSLAYQAIYTTNGQESACQVTTAPAAHGTVAPSGSIAMCCEP